MGNDITKILLIFCFKVLLRETICNDDCKDSNVGTVLNYSKQCCNNVAMSYLKEDHRSYIRNLCSCEKKA